MDRVFTGFAIGGMALSALMAGHAQAGSPTLTNSAGNAAMPAAGLPKLPPMPAGKTTIMGGAIREVDPVRDQLTLNVYGIKPMKILFDERTQVFRDGKRIPLGELGPSAHASVQTTLDGAQVFAVSVHILSEAPQGDFEGQVVSYDPSTGQLVLSAAQGGQPFRLQVASTTSFQRKGQMESSSTPGGTSDLAPGALVAVTFQSNAKGQGVAREITVFATPGSTFVFSGNVTSLDMHTGVLMLQDPRDNRVYQIAFDPMSTSVANLHVGQHARVSADYDGHRYVATQITPE